MKLNDYQRISLRTYPVGKAHRDNLSNFALGLTGEAGEVADMVKKNLNHGHSLQKDEIVKELGDVMFYISSMATLIGVDLETVADINIKKLKKRYKNGFSEEASINRKD